MGSLLSECGGRGEDGGESLGVSAPSRLGVEFFVPMAMQRRQEGNAQARRRRASWLDDDALLSLALADAAGFRAGLPSDAMTTDSQR